MGSHSHLKRLTLAAVWGMDCNGLEAAAAVQVKGLGALGRGQGDRWADLRDSFGVCRWM